jgi:quinol monooxygenase YgiN
MKVTMSAGFYVIYRWKLIPGKEDQFVAAWQTMTEEIRAHAGGLGSRLHESDDGTWVAYAGWPSREAWETADVKTGAAEQAARQMGDAVDDRLDPILLEPVADLLR